MTQLSENLNKIKKSIDQINPKAKLLAVTKSVDASTIKALAELGVIAFGENRSDALLEKQAALSSLEKTIEWHFIGRLQTRQVRTIINQIDYLHSLDRLSLAKEIQKRADHEIKCFVQVNVSGEESKAGFKPEELIDQIHVLSQFDKIKIVGLMTMAPYEATDDALHQIFKTLKELQMTISQQNLAYAPCHELSMGMSHDYPIALSEGATIVRIGTALFEGI
ncbi:YggS family pyridoxal phosphate-dependent enzyme [Fundicoccus culcitae]|uniref:Pyridoxal phosphate homeostasis protein n=1 Tax=Fundicoccus culcitae TaxID=2969821 RepID=A0ABY5P5Z3_9LACT|nr:YggS family pyridoxal phosphate-dependent enzyme [Fundicoccus culcitae]UUX34137.1 YggS family pyridoxal phosphate-dependent enzyme [Fundicoccus culcitae]